MEERAGQLVIANKSIISGARAEVCDRDMVTSIDKYGAENEMMAKKGLPSCGRVDRVDSDGIDSIGQGSPVVFSMI